ncbi:class I SAM-dependent methyltransferase [Flagellimonas pacifica]|uniref:Methyltransferase domain-containing protein n=1 Tax=Flagellimonas pacifica TaxID=1247520 RepID=A0A285MUM8_9FLAO|nr:class I SAM-dependent methyltransferase [Allomuricauda parva]SNZ00899.1 Methyltransferase domain-containing protein [Allomuricauda parva]
MTSPKKTKKPWATKAAMEQIYEAKLWGDNDSDFYSGDGSHHPELVEPYVDALQAFLKSFENPLTVCDLGCGDFNIGKELVVHAKKYIAVDIVEDLINFNREKFRIPNLEFHCLDIAKDDLPIADCAILRQVLQHLSNSEIKNIVDKLYDFKYVVLTEHLPQGDFVSNINIIAGQGTRLKKQSGVDLCEAPFHLKVKEAKRLLSINSPNHGGQLVTTLFKMF